MFKVCLKLDEFYKVPLIIKKYFMIFHGLKINISILFQK
jgi:hypothetical protein